MSHKSENCLPLKIIEESVIVLEENSKRLWQNPSIWLFYLPTEEQKNFNTIEFLNNYLINFIDKLDDLSVVCFLSNAEIACQVISVIEKCINFKVWVAIKRDQPLIYETTLLDNHVSLTIFAKYNSPLKHTKTLIQYSYCPSCHKTTKDYGGKKHLYSPFGTLMSDVWRDITYLSCGTPKDILERLKDIFGLEPYRHLYYVDLRSCLTTLNDISQKYQQQNKNDFIKNNFRKQLIKSNLLINNDCLNYLKLLPDNSIDFIFADPPYNIQKKYDIWDDCQENNQYINWCVEWINELARVLKKGKTLALLNIPIYLAKYYEFSKDILDFQDWIVWEGLSLPVRQIMPAHYGILCLSKGRADISPQYPLEINQKSFSEEKLSLKEWYCIREQCIKRRNRNGIIDRDKLTNLWWDVHRLKHNSKRVDHPCQLPSPLMKRIISIFTSENDLVLDPFNGSGTTTLVASMMGRHYIGIEISENYHVIAEQRHIDLANGLDPFAKRNSIPSAKNSRVNRLKNQKYEVPKKTLQLEVRDIALKIGRKPTKEDIEKYSQYPLRYFKEYFSDWGEVCSAVGDKGMQENKIIDDSIQVDQLELPL